jgi:GNAT superfamily N-acetyltransferase
MTTLATPLDTIADATLQNLADRVSHWARSCGRPLVERDDLVGAHQGERGLFTNTAVVLRPPHDGAGWAAVAEEAAAVVPSPAPVLLVSPVPTPDLGPLGFTLVGHPPVMVRLPGAAPAPVVPSELQLHEVVDQPGLEVWERTLTDAYPMPELQPYRWGRFLGDSVLGGATRFWVGFVDGRPVATASVHLAAGVNQVECISTMDGDRGQGYGAALTWAATTADPSLPAVLMASDPGRPVYERLGYVAITRWTLWLRP